MTHGNWYRDIIEARGGVTCASTWRDLETTLDEILLRFGLKPQSDQLKSLTREAAQETLEALLGYSIVFTDLRCTSTEDSKRLSKEFMDAHTHPDAMFFTNADWVAVLGRNANGFGWFSFTDATFDGGVIAVLPTLASYIWIEGED